MKLRTVFEEMSHTEFLVVLICLIAAVGLVSSGVMNLAPKDSEPEGTLVMNHVRNSQDLGLNVLWELEKWTDTPTIANASGSDVVYHVTATETGIVNGTLTLKGYVDVKNTGYQTAYLGNAVISLMTKNGGWSAAANNTLDYYGSTTVETCIPTGQGSQVIFSEGGGSGDFNLTDSYGNGLFAGALYALPQNVDYRFNYSATFDIAPLGLAPGDEFRERMTFTFINSSKTNGAGTCSGIDADGDGNDDPCSSSLGVCTHTIDSWDPPGSVIPGAGEWLVNFSDQITGPANPGLVTLSDFSIDNSTLKADGSSTYTESFNATGVPGTEHTWTINSTATCTESNGTTSITNTAWLEARDQQYVTGSPATSIITFKCGTVPPDNTPPVIWWVDAVPDLLAGGHLYSVYVNATDDVNVTSVTVTVNGSDYALSYNSSSELWYRHNINAPMTDGTYTVFANATDAAGNYDTDDDETIVVDALPPAIVLEPPLQSGDVITPGTILNFTVTDAHLDDVWFTNDTVNYPLPAPFDVDTSGWPDGTYNVTVYANDTLGNSANSTYVFIIDSEPPEVDLEGDPTTTNSSSNVTFTSNVTDDNLNTSSVFLICDDETPALMNCTGTAPDWVCTYEWLPPGDGVYNCSVTATDLGGNSNTTENITIIIDSIPPSITLNSPTPPGNETYIKPGTWINLTVNNSEYDELDEVWYSVNGSANETLPDGDDPFYYINTSDLECVHTFDVWANDTAGNLAHETYVFNIDGTDPVINSVTVYAADPLYPSEGYKVVVNVTDNKALDKVKVTIDGVAHWLTQNGSEPDLWFSSGLTAPSPGNYTVYAYAVDKAGNSDTDDDAWVYVSTPDAPVIVLVSPANGSVIKNTVDVLVNITPTSYPVDDTWFHDSEDGTDRPFDGKAGTVYSIDLDGYADGTYTFYVFANDTQGTQSSAEYVFTIDSTDPSLGPLAANDTVFPSNTQVHFSINVTENNSLVDDEVNVTCENGETFSFLMSCSGGPSVWACSADVLVSVEDGVYECTAHAEDEAGNEGTSAPLQLIIDSTPPKIKVLSPLPIGSIIASGTIIDLNVTNEEYDELDTVRYKRIGDSWEELDAPYDINTSDVPEGLQCFKAWANDTAGNTASKTFCYIFDNTPPVIHWVEEDPHFTTPGGQFELTAEVTDQPSNLLFRLFGDVEVQIGNLTYSLHHKIWPPSKWNWWTADNLDTPDDDYCGYLTKTVVATDAAGNSATDNSTEIAIVGCYPQIVLNSPPDGSWIYKGEMLDFDILHPFPVEANVSIDGGNKSDFTPVYDLDTTNWSFGPHTVYIEAVDEYGYYSNGTFTFNIRSPDEPPDDDEKFDVDRERICPGNDEKFTVKRDDNSNPVSSAEVKVVRLDPVGWGPVTKSTSSQGTAVFDMPSAGSYKATVTKAGFDPEHIYFSYTMCPSDGPGGCDCPPGWTCIGDVCYPPCDEDTDCPSGQICVDGNCEPGCDDDLDCPSGQVCIEGQCGPGCNDDLDCPSGQVCIEGQCGYGGCDSDEDCEQGEMCVDGQCQALPQCFTDYDCPSDMICVEGTCVPIPPACEDDEDCPPGYECEDGECVGIPDLNTSAEDPPPAGPGDTVVIEVEIRNNGTAPVEDIEVSGDDGGAGEIIGVQPGRIPVLNPGDSANVKVIVKVGDGTTPGDYTVTIGISSEEVEKVEEVSLFVTEEVTPELLSLLPCLFPLLLLALLLLLLLLLFLKKRAVADADSLKELNAAKKLFFAKEYFVTQDVYDTLKGKVKDKCTPVRVTKAEIAAVMKDYKLPKDEATLVAAAQKLKVKKILSKSKVFAKYAEEDKKLEGIVFYTPSDIKGKRIILPFFYSQGEE